jgi:hypothetical protein
MINNKVKDQLDLFNRVDNKEKKSKKKKSLSNKEFKEMCKKAGVKKESLCKTIFTENL